MWGRTLMNAVHIICRIKLGFNYKTDKKYTYPKHGQKLSSTFDENYGPSFTLIEFSGNLDYRT